GTMLARWRKDGRDAQRQATADDLAQHIRMSVCSLEARVVVELGIRWTAMLVPVCFQPFAEPSRTQGGTDPRPAGRAPKCPGRKHVQPGTRLQRKVFDDIERVQFRRSR